MITTALKDARTEYRKFDWHRDRDGLVAEVQRLTNAGVSASTISDLVGLSERHVVRLRSQPHPQPAARYQFDHSDDRAEQLMRLADAALELAVMVRDEDPHLVWDTLCRLNRQPLQELLVVALAAIPVDKTSSEIFGWIEDMQ
jgi:hypothetical protein